MFKTTVADATTLFFNQNLSVRARMFRISYKEFFGHLNFVIGHFQNSERRETGNIEFALPDSRHCSSTMPYRISK